MPGLGVVGAGSVEYRVVGWGDNAPVITDIPEDLTAVKVVFVGISLSRCAAVALKADGTLSVWGGMFAIADYLSGWDSLGGIVDIAGCCLGLLYVTTAGSVGYIGQNDTRGMSTAIPTLSDARRVLVDSTAFPRAFVICESLTLAQWGYTSTLTTFSSPAAAGILDCFASYQFQSYVDGNNDLYIAGDASTMPASPIADAALAVGTRDTLYVYKTDGSWLLYPSAYPQPRPAPQEAWGASSPCTKRASS